MITPDQRAEIARLLFGLYPVLPAWAVRLWVSAATGTPRSVPMRALTQDQARSLISALRAAQARRRQSQAVRA